MQVMGKAGPEWWVNSGAGSLGHTTAVRAVSAAERWMQSQRRHYGCIITEGEPKSGFPFLFETSISPHKVAKLLGLYRLSKGF